MTNRAQKCLTTTVVVALSIAAGPAKGGWAPELDCPGLRDLVDRARASEATGDRASAEVIYKAAISHCRETNPKGIGVAFAIYELAGLYEGDEGWDAAKPLYEESTALFLGNDDVGFPLQIMLQTLSEREESAGRPEQARAWMEQLANVADRIAILASDDPTSRAGSLLFRASIFYEQNALMGAQVLYEHAIQFLNQAGASADPAIWAKAHAGLALVLARMHRSSEAQEHYAAAMRYWSAADAEASAGAQAFLADYAKAADAPGNAAVVERPQAQRPGTSAGSMRP